MSESTTIIAFDPHAQSVMAAVLGPREAEPAVYPVGSDLPTIGRFVKRLVERGPVRCCYEAGPCGFALQRFLASHDVPCEVIAPTLIPRRPGDRIKTDRRDARQLAILYRAGALTPIPMPSELEEATRDVRRCREASNADLLRARHRLSTFLLRHDRRYTETKCAWGPRHTAWLRSLPWPLPALEHTWGPICARWRRRRRGSPSSTRSCAAILRVSPLLSPCAAYGVSGGSVISAH